MRTIPHGGLLDDSRVTAISRSQTIRALGPPALISIVVIALYARTIDDGLYNDDYVLVRPWSWGEVGEAFTGQFVVSGSTAPYFRPLASLLFAAEWQVWQTNLWGYHLTNLALHLTAVVMLYFLLRSLLSSTVAAAIGATFFAVIPANAAAVLYIAERTDTIVAIIILWALVVLRRYEADHRPTALVAINALFAVGLLFKEQATSLVPIVVIFMLYRGIEDHDRDLPDEPGIASHWRREARLLFRAVVDRARLPQRMLVVGSLTATFAVYLVYRQLVMPPGSLSDRFGEGLSPPQALVDGISGSLKGVPWEVESRLIAIVIGLATIVTFVAAPRARAWRLYIAGASVVVAGVLPLTFNGGVEPRLLYVAELGVGIMIGALAAVWFERGSSRGVDETRTMALVAAGALVLAVTTVPLLTRAQDQFAPASEKKLDAGLDIWSQSRARAVIDPAILRDLERRLIDAGRIPAD